MEMYVDAKEIENVYGKKLKYVIIRNGDKQCIINVGEKTFSQVKEMQVTTASEKPKSKA